MKTIFLTIVCLCVFVTSSLALEIGGVSVAPTLTVNQQQLRLNGAGLRSKFFIKVYVGALYTLKAVTTPTALFTAPGDKVIRMYFVRSRVAREKIVEAFRDGLSKNSPAVAESAEARAFLALFTGDFVSGDIVDLFLGADGTVSASQNGKVLGTLRAPALPRAILAIYFGDEPADDDLKSGMLGQN